MLRRLPRPGLAVALIAAALAAWPAFAGSDSKIADARAALQRGDAIGAEVALREALRQGANARDVAALMGEAELLQDDLRLARKWLEPEDFAPQDRGTGFQMLGRLQMEQGDLPAAGAAFDKALRYIPKSPDLWVDIARLRFRGGEQLQAIEAADYALALGPENTAALVMRGQLTRDGTGPVAALPLFARAVVQAPDDLTALFAYGATLGEIGRAKSMLTVARRMVEIDGRDPRGYWLQAVLAARGGHYELARRLMMRTGDAYADDPAAMMLSAVLDLETGNLASARKMAETLSRIQPDNDTVQDLLGRIMAQQGAWAEITTRYGASALDGNLSPYLRTLTARAYEAQNERAKAAPLLDAIARDGAGGRSAAPDLITLAQDVPLAVLAARWHDAPHEGSRFMPYVRALIARGDSARAVEIANELATRFPGSGDIHLLAGDAQLAADDPVRALAHFQKAALVRLSPALRDRMVAASLASGNVGFAKGILAQYVIQHPLDGEAALTLARMFAEGGDWKRGAALSRHALRQPLTAASPTALAFAAQAERRSGNIGKAQELAERAYELAPQNIVVLQSYAAALEASAKADDAAFVQAKLQLVSR